MEIPFPQEETLRRWYQDGGDRNLLNDMELHAWMSSTPLEPFQIPLLDYTCMFWRSYHHIRYKAYSNSPDLVVTTPCIGHSQIYFLIQLFGLFFSFCFCFPLSNKLAWRSIRRLPIVILCKQWRKLFWLILTIIQLADRFTPHSLFFVCIDGFVYWVGEKVDLFQKCK